MIEFEALDVYRGWKVHSIPDALSIEMRLESTEHRFSISIVDLVRIFALVQRREEGHVFFGTGRVFELENVDEEFADLRMPPISIRLPVEDIEDALEDALREVFARCDEIDDDQTRTDEFEVIQQMLEQRDCDIDIRELYERLSNSPGQ